MPLIYPVVMLRGGEGPAVTWDPANKGANITLSNGNLDADGATAFNTVRTTVGKTAGKYYAELLVDTLSASAALIVGLVDSAATFTTWAGNSSAGRGAQGNATSYATTWTAGSAQAGFAVSNVIGLAFDMSSGKAFIAVGNTWQGSSDPVTQANPWATGLAGTVYVATSPSVVGNRVTLRSRNVDFSFTPPAGYLSFATL